jgi:tetratricopeptide (TPR) repeat protein
MKLNTTRFLKSAALAVPLALSPIAATIMLDAVGVQSSLGKAQAQEDAPKRETRKTPALSQAVFKKLGVVNALVSPPEDAKDQEPKFDEALAELKKLESKDATKWNEYELANLYNTYGFVYYNLENYTQAVKYYKLVIAQSPNIPLGLEISTLYTVAQLQFVSEDYAGALESLQAWFKQQDPMFINSDNYALLSQAYYQNKDFDNSLKSIYTAIDLYKEKGKEPKENWYSIALAIEFERENYTEVAGILEILVRSFPKPSYYKQLSGIYGLIGKERGQVYLSDATYVAGMVDKEQEALNLVFMMLGEGYSYRAAKILETGISSELIEKTSKNLEHLSNAWLISQETDKAIAALTEAAALSNEGDLYARLAGLYVDDNQEKKALEIADKALELGDVKREDSLYVSIGMANANLGRWQPAINAFKEAAKDKRSKAFAENWMKYSQGELVREQKLAE